MSVQDTLDLLYKKAKEDDSLRQKPLTSSWLVKNPMQP